MVEKKLQEKYGSSAFETGATLQPLSFESDIRILDEIVF
jgi:hypothetical protein